MNGAARTGHRLADATGSRRGGVSLDQRDANEYLAIDPRTTYARSGPCLKYSSVKAGQLGVLAAEAAAPVFRESTRSKRVSHPNFRRSCTTAFSSLGSFFWRLPLYAGVLGSTSPINLDASGLALRGYDPVAYFETGKPRRGMPRITASYGGAHYLFATKAHRKSFVNNPTKYLPQFGGFCAVGTSFGEKVDVDPETGKIVNGKLYLNNGPKAQAIFDSDPGHTISRAEHSWPTVKDKAL